MARIGPMLQRVRELVEELGPTGYLDLPLPPLPVRVTADPQGTGLQVGVFVTAPEPGILADYLPRLADSGAFDVTTRTRRTAVGTVDPQNLGQFSEIADSIQVEAAAAVYPELDHSVPEAWNAASSPSWSGSRPTGQGVIVGIVDNGIDVTHPSFRTSSGTRILRLWDQEPRGSTLAPLPYRYGSEWDEAAINSYLASGLPFPSTDGRGHGTAVAGVLAGNGMATPQGQYVGVAEDAYLVVVKLNARAYQFSDTSFVVQGIDYIFTYAESQGRPAVVNLSQGSRLGPHDPNGQFEMAIQDLLEENDHRILVKSTGNDAAADAHTSLVFDRGDTERYVNVDVPKGVGPSVTLDIWYDVSDLIAIEVIDPGQVTSGLVQGNDRATRWLSTDRCQITGWPNRHFGASQIKVLIEGAANTRDVTPGIWTFRFVSSAMESGQPVHAWLEQGLRRSPRFLTRFAKMHCTATSPAAAKSVICVGSYTMGPTHSLARSSSLGPDRLGNTPALLAAPGSPITSCDSSQRPATTGPYRSVNGTSFAAPHVTGAIALMLQVYPEMTRDQAISCLQGTCRKDNDTNAGPTEGWGSGKLDIGSAIHCILNQTQQDGSRP